MKYKKPFTQDQSTQSLPNENNNRGIFGRMLGNRSASPNDFTEEGGVDSQPFETVLSDNDASLAVINDDLQAISKLAQGFEAEQRSLSASLASQLEELKAVQVSTHDYEQHLKDLLQGPIQMLEERVSNRVDLKTWYDEVSRIKTQLHNILSSVNEQHNQGAQLQRVCEAQDKRVQQLENQCRELEQSFSQKRVGSDYSDQRLSKTMQQLREQQGQFERSLRQLSQQRVSDKGQLVSIKQQLQNIQNATEQAHAKHEGPELQEWQSLLSECHTQMAQVQKAQASLEEKSAQIAAVANTALQQFTETQQSVSKMHAYREAIKQNLRQFQQDYQQHTKNIDSKLAVVDERIGHLDTLVQDSQQALVLANNARKVVIKFNQDVDAKLQDIRHIDQSIQNSLHSSQQWANQFTAFEERIAALVSDLDTDKKEEQALLQELSAYRTTFEQHFQDWSQFKSWCQQLSENLVTAEAQLTQEKLQVTAYLAETENLVKVVHQDAQQLNGQHNVVEQSLQQLKNLYQQVNGLLEQHQQGRLSVENLLASEKALNHELCTQSQQVSATLQDMTSRLQDFDGLSAQIKQDQGCVRALISSCKTLIATAKIHETQNGEHILKISEALETFKQMQSSFTTITHQYGQMHQQAKVLNQELVDGTQQLQALENKVDTSCNVLISLSEREQQRAEQLQNNLQHIQQLQQNVVSYQEDSQEKLQMAQKLQAQAQLCLQQTEQLREQIQSVLQKTAETAMSVQVQASENQLLLQTSEQLAVQQQQIKADFQQQLQQLDTLQKDCLNSLQQAKHANERSSRQQHDLDVDRQQVQKSLSDSEALLLENRDMLEQLGRLQQQVVEACSQVSRTEQQAYQLLEGVHSANQSAQQCISDIHQVKQQTLDLCQQGEQLLHQSKQQQQDFHLSLVAHETWHQQYADLAESAQQAVKQVLECDAQLHAGLQQQQQIKAYIEEKCVYFEQQFSDNLQVSQQFQQRTAATLTEVQTTISQYRDGHLRSQNSLIKSEELHTKIAQLLESSKDHAHQVDAMRRQIQTEIANLNRLGEQQQTLHGQLTPYVSRFQEMEQQFIRLGEQWSVQMQQAEVEQRQQQALNRRCQQLQATTETLQSSLETQLKSSQVLLQENQQQLTETQMQFAQAVQAQSVLQQDLSRYSHFSEQLTEEQKRYRALHQSLQEAHQQVQQQLSSAHSTQAEQGKLFADLQQRVGGVHQHNQINDQRLDRLEAAMDQVMRSFKEFVGTHHESKNLNKETFLAAKEQKLLLKEMENEIKELKFALKVREKSPTGYVGRQYAQPSSADVPSAASRYEQTQYQEPQYQEPQYEMVMEAQAPIEQAASLSSEKMVSSGREWLDDLAQMDVMEAPIADVQSADRRGFKGFLFSLVLMAGLLMPMNQKILIIESIMPIAKLAVVKTDSSAEQPDAIPVQGAAAPVQTRQWTWPVEAHQAVHYSDFRSGVYLIAALQAPIRAAQPGVVVYTGEHLPGLGQVVILQHPHELMTIYGNNLQNLVNKGDVVSSGQVIARIGQMGNALPALYFEVRYQGKAEDPFLYWSSSLALS